ncbi:MAG: hypothetical protein AAF915_09110 [Cyanobacteria bacterium P01_D01_bin.50]
MVSATLVAPPSVPPPALSVPPSPQAAKAKLSATTEKKNSHARLICYKFSRKHGCAS